MPLNRFNNCFRAATTKETPFSPKNRQKIPIFTQNQCSPGPGGQFVPPLPYLEGAGLGTALGTGFFAQIKWIKYLSLQVPNHLLFVNEEQEWEAIPLKETTCPRPTLQKLMIFLLAPSSVAKQESILASLSLHQEEVYTLDSAAKHDVSRELGLNANTCNCDFVDLSASKENADGEYFCTLRINNTGWYDLGKLGAWKMLYDNRKRLRA